MLDCISVDNMRCSDRQTIARGTSGIELIRRAAAAVFAAVEWKAPVAIAVGSGNNGADGYALACLLHRAGISCTLIDVSGRLSADGAYYAAQAEALGVPKRKYAAGEDCFRGYSVIVDCLLGTGFHGHLRENYRCAIGEINAAEAYVVSVDINSGMDGDTGLAALAVRSDLTVTIGFVKNGMVLPAAGAYMNRLICVDIGIGLARDENKICTRTEWAALGGAGDSVVREGTVYYRCPPWLQMA